MFYLFITYFTLLFFFFFIIIIKKYIYYYYYLFYPFICFGFFIFNVALNIIGVICWGKAHFLIDKDQLPSNCTSGEDSTTGLFSNVATIF